MALQVFKSYAKYSIEMISMNKSPNGFSFSCYSLTSISQSTSLPGMWRWRGERHASQIFLILQEI